MDLKTEVYILENVDARVVFCLAFFCLKACQSYQWLMTSERPVTIYRSSWGGGGFFVSSNFFSNLQSGWDFFLFESI